MPLLEWPKIRTLITPSAGEGVEQQELSPIASENPKWYSHFGRQFLTKLNILLPYNPSVMFLDT